MGLRLLGEDWPKGLGLSSSCVYWGIQSQGRNSRVFIPSHSEIGAESEAR